MLEGGRALRRCALSRPARLRRRPRRPVDRDALHRLGRVTARAGVGRRARGSAGCAVRSSPQGCDFSWVGGHTSCIALGHDGGRRRSCSTPAPGCAGCARAGRCPVPWDLCSSVTSIGPHRGAAVFSAGDRDDAVVRSSCWSKETRPRRRSGERCHPRSSRSPPINCGAHGRSVPSTRGEHRSKASTCWRGRSGTRAAGRRLPHQRSSWTLPRRTLRPRGRRTWSRARGLGALHSAVLELADSVHLLVDDAEYTATGFLTAVCTGTARRQTQHSSRGGGATRGPALPS